MNKRLNRILKSIEANKKKLKSIALNKQLRAIRKQQIQSSFVSRLKAIKRDSKLAKKMRNQKQRIKTRLTLKNKKVLVKDFLKADNKKKSYLLSRANNKSLRNLEKSVQTTDKEFIKITKEILNRSSAKNANLQEMNDDILASLKDNKAFLKSTRQNKMRKYSKLDGKQFWKAAGGNSQVVDLRELDYEELVQGGGYIISDSDKIIVTSPESDFMEFATSEIKKNQKNKK